MQRIFVPGRHLCEAHYETHTVTRRSWYSPDLNWFAEFKSECDVFERVPGGWRAECDGFEYRIPERWCERVTTSERW